MNLADTTKAQARRPIELGLLFAILAPVILSLLLTFIVGLADAGKDGEIHPLAAM